MTGVQVYQKQDYVDKIIIKGHALSGEYGHDVVCAGISTVVTGICNALEELSDYAEKMITYKEGYVEIPNLIDDAKVQLIIDVLIVQLKTIENVYSDYIEISYL
jgi:uncharacterized protein